ncbi:MAG: hypothetical protein PF513_06980 [Tenericutes bacterium]|jgi:hypothetical protein|nr:hypothetical protein [Mycoplasmatota bacterium]
MEKLINNADIVLMSGNMTNIFFDMEFYNYNKANFNYDILCQHLNTNRNKLLKTNGKWLKPDENSESSLKTRLSASSFKTHRKKHNTIHFEINDFNFDNLVNDSKLSKYEIEYKEIKKYLPHALQFNNTLLKFGSYGDVTFHTTVSLKNASINAKEYNTISAFIRNIARDLFHNIVRDACIEYIEIIEKDISDKEFQRIFFEIENIFELKDKLEYSVERSMYTITWVHLIYDDDYNDLENKKLADKIAFKEEKLDYIYSPSHESHIFLGWSHTIFFLINNQNRHQQDEIYYHLTPIENEFAEWEFIIAMKRNIERLLFHSYSVFESNKFFFVRTTQFKNNINQLFFFIQRIMRSYDNTSITINQYQAKLMEAQEKKWEISKYYDSFEDKSESLYKIVDYMINRKKSIQSKVLNGILFVIALFSTIEISNSIYQIIHNNDSFQLLFSIGPAFTILIIIILYNRISRD